METRVVITGMGVITPIGTGKQAFWDALVAGKSGIDRITHFDASTYPAQIAGEVKDFDPSKYLDKKEARRLTRFIQLAVASARIALEDSNLIITAENAPEIGVLIGSGIGGIGFLEEQARTLHEKGVDKISPFTVPYMICDMAAGFVSIVTGAKGPNSCVVTACATGTNSIGEAFKLIQRGAAKAMITGGTEASVTPLGVASFCAARALTGSHNHEPQRASRPFDKNRDGFVMGEGSGIVILEELGYARARGANIIAEVIGYGMSGDASHITAPAPEGEGAVRAIRAALKDANITPEQVDYINAHGTSTELNDKFETMAIKTVFGERAKVPISSNKSMVGHLLGATGATELVASVMSILNSTAPPTINYETPDPECDLDYVPNQARKMPINIAISNSFGFGGHNAILVVKKYSE